MYDSYNADRDSSNAEERKDYKAITGHAPMQWHEQEKAQNEFSDRVNEARYGEVINQ